MATKFSFTIHRALTEEEKKKITSILGSSLLRSETWYSDNQDNLKYQNPQVSATYGDYKKMCNYMSLCVGALGEYIKVEEEKD